MKEDYILISVNQTKVAAVRFISLQHLVQESIQTKRLNGSLAKPYAEFLTLCSLIGSRLKDQESTLFKLNIASSDITVNVEVSPKGPMRSAVFPLLNKKQFQLPIEGTLTVKRLKRDNQVYESVVEVKSEGILETMRNYLDQSEQSESVLMVNVSEDDHKKSFGLWVERLPETSKDDWQEFIKQFDEDKFAEVVSRYEDPDKIVQSLFQHPIRILAVTKPRLQCTCSKEMIIAGLKSLPNEELVDMFMSGQGVETQCDYCQKVWSVSDQDIKNLLKISGKLQ